MPSTVKSHRLVGGATGEAAGGAGDRVHDVRALVHEGLRQLLALADHHRDHLVGLALQAIARGDGLFHRQRRALQSARPDRGT